MINNNHESRNYRKPERKGDAKDAKSKGEPTSPLLYLIVIITLFAIGGKDVLSEGYRRGAKDYNIKKVLPPDAIPAIKNPEFVSAHEAKIHPDEPVIGLSINGDNRAYSIYLLNSHEIVNDIVGGKPVVVAWCPLANLAAVYTREIDDKVFTFGVSGKLLKNTLVMFDYETGSLWTAISGESLEGDMAGGRLKELTSAQKLTWGEWLRLHPDTKALSYHGRETAGYDNYRDYHNSWLKTGILPVENKDSRLKVKSIVIGLDINGKRKAYPLGIFKDTNIVTDDFQGLPLLLYHDKASNYTVVYNRKIDNTALEFSRLDASKFRRDANDVVIDAISGSKWDLKAGNAMEGSLKGKAMTKVKFRNVYWFIWADYYPDSEIYR